MKAKEEDLRQKLKKKTIESKEHNLREKLLAKKATTTASNSHHDSPSNSLQDKDSTVIAQDSNDKKMIDTSSRSRSHRGREKNGGSRSRSPDGARTTQEDDHRHDRNRHHRRLKEDRYVTTAHGHSRISGGSRSYRDRDYTYGKYRGDSHSYPERDPYYHHHQHHQRDPVRTTHPRHPPSDRNYHHHNDRDGFGRNYRHPQSGRRDHRSRSYNSRSRSYSRSRGRSASSSSSSSNSSRSSSGHSSYSRNHRRRGCSRSSSSHDTRSSVSSRSRSRSIDHHDGGSKGHDDRHSRRYNRSSKSKSHAHSRSRSRSHRNKRSRSNDVERDGKRRSIHRSSSENDNPEDELTKDQRTLFVSQLVMKSDDRDIKRYFRKQLDIKVNNVIMLLDKRTGRHKGSAYVEISKLEDVAKALEASGKVPDFQRFPILVKASETSSKHTTHTGDESTRIEAQKVYVGNIDQNFTQSQLYAIFSQFGQLDRVMLQLDPVTALSKGYAFFSYTDPKVANLAIQVMSGQIMGGKPLKTGWANQNAAASNLKEVTSIEFPSDCISRIEKTNVVFKQLNGTSLSQTTGMMLVPGLSKLLLKTNEQILSQDAMNALITVIAEEAVNIAMGTSLSAAPSTISLPPNLWTEEQLEDVENPKFVLGTPSRNILVRNMFDKDEETEEGWAEDIKLDFEEEGGKYGKIQFVKVISKEVGGKIYASFDSVEGAASCAESLAGRWFDKRQLRIEFIDDNTMSLISRD